MRRFLFFIFVTITSILLGCSGNKYTVTFDSNGGTEEKSIDVFDGDKTGLPNPERIGYSFAGWYTGFGVNDDQFTNNDVVTEDITLYAKWDINQYMISFDVDGGSTVESIVEDYDTVLTEPSHPTKDGYQFVGWYSDEALTTAYTFTTMPAEDITLYAKWEFTPLDYILLENGNDYGVKIKDSVKATVEDLTIVSKYHNKPVTQILEDGFKDCTKLKSISIPGSMKRIGISAFDNCRSLTSIVIPESVTSIGRDAFSGCTSLTSINLPKRITTIESSLFFNCISLTSITIPVSMTSINYNAFGNCRSLTSIIIPENVISIGPLAFSSCLSLTSITIPESVTSIGRSAFSYCNSLTSITLPESVTIIDEYTFANCKSLTSITILGNITSIGQHAFTSCKSLTSINIPETVTSIGDYAFSYCFFLKSITIPENVASMGIDAFAYCNSLTINCVVASQPVTWNATWNSSDRPVMWGYVSE